MKTGTIVRLKCNILNNKPGTYGVCYEVYGTGASFIFENGEYDGFSNDDQMSMLNVVGFSQHVSEYKFTNVIKLSTDFKKDHFDFGYIKSFHLSESNESISASYVKDGRLSIASADFLVDAEQLGTKWYVSRVNVTDIHRGNGIGSMLLKMLIESIKMSKNKHDIVVCPGGYENDQDRQINFYKKNGFVETKTKGLLIFNFKD